MDLEYESLCLASIIEISVYVLILSTIYKKSTEIYRRSNTKPHITEEIRNKIGAYTTLFKYFYVHNHEEFIALTRMTVDQFDLLYELIRPKLSKPYTTGRKPLSSNIKLAATLQ